MRLKKASTNVIVNMLTFIISLLPSFILRKAFLDSLGNELLGLNSLYTNIIGLISIVELGIGSAIIYSLYKPFADKNYSKINGYLSYYSRVYKIVGFIILSIGLCMTPFINTLYNGSIDLSSAQKYFLLMLINTYISYLFSYKLCVLIVAQEEYKISIATALSKLTISIIQIISLEIYPSLYIYLLIQIIINTIYYISLNYYINRRFRWVGNKETLNRTEIKELNKNIKAIFMHKIGGMLVFGTDNIIISAFISLTTVGIFNSYQLIIGSAQGLISSSLSGVTASIGNLLTNGDEKEAYLVHKRLFFISFWIISMITISLFNTIHQFVGIWLGKGQLLDSITTAFILINFYFILMRGPTERFKESGGIYHQDRYAPFIEAAINLGSSLLLVKYIGLPGVFLGTLISNLCIVFWLKPLLVYRHIFKVSITRYFIMYFKYLGIASIPLVITGLITHNISKSSSVTIFILNCFINIVTINIIYLVILRKTEEFLYFKNIFQTQIIQRFTKLIKREKGFNM